MVSLQGLIVREGVSKNLFLCHEYIQGGDGVMDKEKIASWLHERLSRAMDIPMNEIDRGTAFSDYGLDSATGIALIGELNELFHITLDPGILWDFPTITALSEYLERLLSGRYEA